MSPFSDSKLTLPAALDEMPKALDFISEKMGDISEKSKMRVLISAEEIFANIASYAYPPGSGIITIECNCRDNEFFLRFTDTGTPYDPLARPDPDITLPASERPVGGLGILMTKKFMDEVHYEYCDGCNILSLRKNL